MEVIEAATLATASRLAGQWAEVLEPTCQRIQVAGSIRRQAPEVKDIELVCVPKTEASGLFGHERQSHLLSVADDLEALGRWERVKGQDKYRQYRVPIGSGSLLMKLDLFMVPAEAWGVQLAIRTGPAAYSKQLVTPVAYGGLMPDGHQIENGKLWRFPEPNPYVDEPLAREPVPTPEEADLFEYYGITHLPPEQRQ